MLSIIAKTGNRNPNKGTIVRMSSVLIGVGQRLLSVRTKLGYPQSKIAAILGIADRSYKNYELEKRELPLAIAVKFCESFEVDLPWLIYGVATPYPKNSVRLVGETVKAVCEFDRSSQKDFTIAELEKFGNYIFEQSIIKGTSPKDEAKQFFSVIA